MLSKSIMALGKIFVPWCLLAGPSLTVSSKTVQTSFLCCSGNFRPSIVSSPNPARITVPIAWGGTPRYRPNSLKSFRLLTTVLYVPWSSPKLLKRLFSGWLVFGCTALAMEKGQVCVCLGLLPSSAGFSPVDAPCAAPGKEAHNSHHLISSTHSRLQFTVLV